MSGPLPLSAQAGIDLGGLQAKLALSPAKRPDARALLDELVQMLVALARRTALLVVFDEYQSTTDGKLRHSGDGDVVVTSQPVRAGASRCVTEIAG